MTLLNFNVFGLIEISRTRIWILGRATTMHQQAVEEIISEDLKEEIQEIQSGEKHFILFAANIGPDQKTTITTRQLKSGPKDQEMMELPQVKQTLGRVIKKIQRSLDIQPSVGRAH